MKRFESKNYERVIAIKEMSAGNESVGDMWLQTRVFDKKVSVESILEWADDCSGKLIITIDENTITEKGRPF